MQQAVSRAAANASDIRFSAMNLLALREHSVKELQDKLGRKFAARALIDEVIADLIELNLQSDERFTQAFIAMRQRQGKGPLIITLELRDRGIDPELIDQFVDDADLKWVELAQQVWRKKFRGAPPADARERIKQMRFLHSRGFSGHHIQAVFSTATCPDW